MCIHVACVSACIHMRMHAYASACIRMNPHASVSHPCAPICTHVLLTNPNGIS